MLGRMQAVLSRSPSAITRAWESALRALCLSGALPLNDEYGEEQSDALADAPDWLRQTHVGLVLRFCDWALDANYTYRDRHAAAVAGIVLALTLPEDVREREGLHDRIWSIGLLPFEPALQNAARELVLATTATNDLIVLWELEAILVRLERREPFAS